MSEALRHPVTNPPTVPGPVAPMAPFFQWIADTGFHADIKRLRTSYPEIGW